MKLTRKNLKITKKTLFSFKNQSNITRLVLTGDPTATMITTVVTTTY